MSCLSWNIWGLGNHRTFLALHELVCVHSLTFIFFCETKISQKKAKITRGCLGFCGCFFVDSKGCGDLMLIRDSYFITIRSFLEAYIDSIVCDGLVS